MPENLSFRSWLKRTQITDDPVGDFVQDSRELIEKPSQIRSPGQLRAFLYSRNACPECLECVPKIWKRYLAEREDLFNQAPLR